MPLWDRPIPGYQVSLAVVAISMSWTRVGVAVEVLTWVTRAQSRFSPPAPPAGSQPMVDANVRTLSCQIASVGLRSTISGSMRPPGGPGRAGWTNGGTTLAVVRSPSADVTVPPEAFEPVI